MTFYPITKESVDVILDINSEFSDGWNKAMLISGFDGGRFFVLGAKVNEQTVGYISYSVACDEADIESVVVKNEFRRRGIAYALVQQAEQSLKGKGVKKLFLEVRENNLSARSLYQKSGFIDLSVRKKYYPDGENAVVMVKEL